jgi:hypothetical protein
MRTAFRILLQSSLIPIVCLRLGDFSQLLVLVPEHAYQFNVLQPLSQTAARMTNSTPPCICKAEIATIHFFSLSFYPFILVGVG